MLVLVLAPSHSPVVINPYLSLCILGFVLGEPMPLGITCAGCEAAIWLEPPKTIHCRYR
jgi:hypothetical protein